MMGILGTKNNGIDLLDQETVEEKLGVFQSMLQELPSKSLQLAIKVLIAILLLVVGIQIIKLIRKLVKKALTRGHADVGVVQFLDSAVKTILYVLLFFMILNNFGIQTTSIVAVLASVTEGKITFLAACGKNAVASGVKAGDIIKHITKICGGSGGGKPDSAMGGGKDVLKLDDALAAVDDFVAEKLG